MKAQDMLDNQKHFAEKHAQMEAELATAEEAGDEKAVARVCKKIARHIPTQGLHAKLGPGDDDYVIMQPKLDGIRCIASLRTGDMFTRTRQAITSMPHIAAALRALGEANCVTTEDLWVDGEIYREGWSLQKISGTVRRQAKSKKYDAAVAGELQLHLFDTVREGPFWGVRHKHLLDLLDKGGIPLTQEDTTEDQVIVCVPTWEDHASTIHKHHDELVAAGGEGLIVRVGHEEDTYHRGKRPPTLLKVKKHSAEEFEVIEVVPEKGRAPDDQRVGSFLLRMEDGRTFNSNLAMTEEDLVTLWGERAELIGAHATVKYFGITPDKGEGEGAKPNLPRVMSIRYDLQGAAKRKPEEAAEGTGAKKRRKK